MSIAITTQIICFTILSLVILIGALGVVLLESIVYSAFLLGGVFMSVAGLYLLLNASFVAAAQVLVYVGAVNVLIIFAIMLVNKKEDLKPINDIKSRRIISTLICLTLLSLLIRVDLTNVWKLAIPQNSIGEESTIRIGEHLFSDYLLPFEVASVLFCIGIWGLLNSRNAVRVLMSIELMLNAVNINLMTFSSYTDNNLIQGQVFTIFVITVAAAEAAVGLAILLSLYRNRVTVDMESFNLLKW